MNAATNTPTTGRSCPDWCTSHTDETGQGEGFVHSHSWNLGELRLFELSELHENDGSLIERGLDIVESVEMLTIAECRTLSALLLEIAEFLEMRGLDAVTHDAVRLREMGARQ